MDVFSIPCSHQEIFLEILLSLDAKSVTRFKLASKSWYNFLSNPSFSKLYFKSRPSITGFFYRTSKSYVQKIQYVPLHPNQEPVFDPTSCLGFLDDPAILFNSCNGLLQWRTSSNQHFISNPLNKKFVPIYWPFHDTRVFASGIVFDPSVSSDQFEVVVFLVESPNRLKSNSFSSEKMKWGWGKECSVRNSTIKPYCPNHGVFINGVLYWELKNNSLLAYNVNNKIDWLNTLPKMSNLRKKLSPGCLGESKGKLHYCRVVETMLFVWKHRSANSATWDPLHMIELSGLVMYGRSPSLEPSLIHALAFLDDCNGVLLSMENEIKAYNLEEGLVKKVCQVRTNGLPCVEPSMFFPFVHTLALSTFQSEIVNHMPFQILPPSQKNSHAMRATVQTFDTKEDNGAVKVCDGVEMECDHATGRNFKA